VITGPLKWYTVAAALEAAVYAELSTKPDRHSVVPGAIAWDECDCGLLAVSVAQIYLSDSFPNPATAPAGIRCDAAYEVGEFVLQIIRCAPNPDGVDDLVPTTTALDASAQEVLQDAYELLKGASEQLCQMDDARDISSFMLRPLTSQGPTGGCVGNELRAYVALGRN
jgi:hypothetical protein